MITVRSRRPLFSSTCTLILLVQCGIAAAQSPITSIAFADAKTLVAASQEGIKVYSYPELELKSVHNDLPWPNIHDVVFSFDHRTIVLAGGSPTELGGVAIYEWPDWHRIQQHDLHDDVSYDVALSADSQWLASASGDRQLVLIDLKADGRPAQRLTGHSQPVTAVVMASAEMLVSAGVDHSLRVWSLPEGQLLRTLENHTAPVTDLAVRPNSGGPLMVASCGEDATVRFWQPSIGRLVRFARLPSAPQCIAWTPGGRMLIAGCRDGHVRAVDPESVTITGDEPACDGWIYCIVVDDSGNEAVVGGQRGQLRRVSLGRMAQNTTKPANERRPLP